ncbi:KCNH7 [Symbiodinium sp. CCMP2592]|nr:KCNH7 [Symbiodinium sp. CCMP2592]
MAGANALGQEVPGISFVSGGVPQALNQATGNANPKRTTAAKPKADDESSDSGLSSSSSKSEQTKKTPKSNPTWHTEVSPPGAVPTEPSVASVPARKRRASVDELMLKAKSGAAEAYRGLTMDPAKALQKKRERLQEAWVEPESIIDEMSSFEKGCGYRFVLKESSYLRKSWSFIVALLLLYTGTVFPYKLAFIEFYIGASEEFEKSTERAWMPVELTVDILFWIDLFLIFLFSYKDENLQVEVCDLKAIGCRYLKGFFFVNFLACVPPSWFSVLFSGGGEDSSSSLNKSLRLSRLHRTSRLARLARLGRLAKLAPFLHESATWKYIQAFRGVRMMNLTVGLMWVVHLMACGWYLCAALHEEPNDTWVARRSINNDGDVLMGQDPSEQWVHALYFILTIFTTVGFGDMSAFTTAETLYVDWAMIVGTVVNSIIMSEVITTLTGVDRAQAELNKRYALIKEFSEHARLSGKVTTAFEKAVQRASHAGEMRVDPALMKSFFASDTLPRELMLDLTRDLFQGMLIRNEILVTVESHGIPLSSRLPLILAAVMHPKQFQFQDVVYQNADQPIHIYLVMRGYAVVVGEANMQALTAGIRGHKNRIEPATFTFEGHLPEGTPLVIIEEGMKAEEVRLLGKTYVNDIDWASLATWCGKPELADLFRATCQYTRWRRHPRVIGNTPGFACTSMEGAGIKGPYGRDLVTATIKLVACGESGLVKQL